MFKRTENPTHTPVYTRLVDPFTLHVSDTAQFYIANLGFQGKKIFSTIKKLGIEVVFGSNLAVCTLGLELSKLTGAKSIFDLSDFFPGSVGAYYPGANKASASSLYALAKLITDYNIRRADLCTTCSTALKEYALNVAPNTRVQHLPNGVDTKVFAPKPASESLNASLGLEENTLVYVGSIESWLDFDVVFDAITILKKEGVKIQLLIVGRSIYSENGNPIAEKIAERGLERQVKFVGYQPYETLPTFINSSIGGIIPFKTTSLLTQMAFPNKLLEYMACGKPVFAPQMMEMKKVGGRFLLPYSNPESLAFQIKNAISENYDPEEIRRSVLCYDWNIIAEKLEVFMQELIK